MVVLNSVSRDARVLKEAASLVAAGHEVNIIGVRDNNYPDSFEITGDGVKINRINLAYMKQSLVYLRKALFFLFFGISIIFINFFSLSLSNVILLISFFFFISSAWLFRKFYFVLKASSNSDADTNGHSKMMDFFSSGKQLLACLLRLYPVLVVIRQMKPEIIHCHDVYTLPIGALLKLRKKCIVVYDAHEIYEELPQQDNSHRYKCHLIHRFCQGFVDRFITINTSIANWYAKSYPCLPKAEIIMNASRKVDKFDYDFRLHQAAGLPEDAKILLYQGGFATHRGLKCLVEGAKFLPENWFLVMMGWGGYEPELKVIAKQINHNEKKHRKSDLIRFIPPAPQEELVLWTAGATIGVIPYENKGLNHWFCTPNKLWEYPNAGVPILISPFPEMKYFVEKYGHGWFLPEKLNSESFGQVIQSLKDSDIHKAKEASFNFIKQNHWGIFEARLLSLYTELSSETIGSMDGNLNS